MDAPRWRDRFDAFVAKKTRDALTATLPPYITECDQPLDDMVSIGNAWTTALFGGPFYVSANPDSKRPTCSLVFVRSADGNTVAANPADLGGGSTDLHLIYEGLSRVAANAVLAGAGTVRGGDVMFSVWHPELVRLRTSLGLPRHPIQIVATLGGLELDRMLLFNIPDVSAIVLTVADAAEQMRAALRTRPWVRLIVMRDRHALRDAFDQLGALSLERISCIGGRRLAHSLGDADLIDDVYLTTSPKRGGDPDTPLPASALTGSLIVRKRGTGEETGVVFEHLAPVSRMRGG